MNTGLRRWTALAVAVSLGGAPLSARAQSPTVPPAPTASTSEDDPVAQAATHYTRAVKLYQEDDYRSALIEFERAYELAPNWAVLYNLGQAHYQLREYPEALKALEKYVQEGGAGIAADRREQVDREINELRGRVARVTPVSNVDGADVALDDVPLGKTPAREPVVVGAGRHRLTATKPGFVSATQVVDIAGGDQLTIRLDLTPEAPVLPATPLRLPRETPSYTAAVVSGVFAVAGIAVGSVFGVLAIDDKSSLRSECTSAKVCPTSAQGDIDAFSRNGAISTVGFAVGAAGLVLGGYFFFHERARSDAPAPQAITPWIGPGAAGVTGAF